MNYLSVCEYSFLNWLAGISELKQTKSLKCERTAAQQNIKAKFILRTFFSLPGLKHVHLHFSLHHYSSSVIMVVSLGLCVNVFQAPQMEDILKIASSSSVSVLHRQPRSLGLGTFPSRCGKRSLKIKVVLKLL